MEKDWTKIKIYTNPIEAEIVKLMLIDNDIPAVLLNKQDSSYHFGKIELYVAGLHQEAALELIEQTSNTDNEDAD